MEVKDQLHAAVAFTPQIKGYQYPFNRRMCSPQSYSRCDGDGKYSNAHTNIQTSLPLCVTLLTKLSQFALCESISETVFCVLGL